MATFDQLSAEQRAIIELVLRQGKSYAELAQMLDMPEERVRELAHGSLEQLAPVTAAAVEEDWRGQLVDYVLGQQAGTEATATRGHLRRSEPARAWTRSLLDSLDFLYPNGLPEIPEGRGGGRRRDADGERDSTPLSPEARAAIQRRRLLAAGGIVALLLVVVLLWPVGLLTGGDDDSDDGGGEQSSQQATANQPAGVAVVALKDDKYSVLVQAAKLPRLKRDQAYEVWLYNSQGDAKSLGAQVLDANGTYSGQSAPLPRSEIERYRFVDVSREPVDSETAHSGTSVLRGRLRPLRNANPKQGQAAPVSNAVLRPPRS